MLDKFLKMFFALFVLVVMVILIGPQKSLMWLLRGVLVGCAIKSLWHLARIVALKTTLRAFHRENPRYQNWTKSFGDWLRLYSSLRPRSRLHYVFSIPHARPQISTGRLFLLTF
jgi:hypothetical protein